MSDTLIDIMRHGEPQGGRRYRGSSVDDPLSDKGWQQMRDAVADTECWDHIISSPLSRCQAFANELAAKLNIACSTEEQLKEIGFGAWEGRTSDDIQENESEALAAFLRDPVQNRPQGAEPLHDFAERVWNVYQRLADKHQGQHILIVAHAGVVRAITSKILGMALNDVYSHLRVEYAAIAHSKISLGKSPMLVLK